MKKIYDPNKKTKVRNKSKDLDVKLGSVIKCLRKDNNISLANIASDLSLTYQQVQKYESGSNRITVSSLLKICKTIGVKPSSVMKKIEGEGEGVPCECLFSVEEYMKYLKVQKMINSLIKVMLCE